MKKFLLLLLLLIPSPADGEEWFEDCNSCAGDRKGYYICTVLSCDDDWFNKHTAPPISTWLDPIRPVEEEILVEKYTGDNDE